MIAVYCSRPLFTGFKRSSGQSDCFGHQWLLGGYIDLASSLVGDPLDLEVVGE